MGRTIAEALLAEGEVKGARAQLRFVLEKKFGPLPEAVIQRIEALEDQEKINDLAFQAMTGNSLDDLRW